MGGAELWREGNHKKKKRGEGSKTHQRPGTKCPLFFYCHTHCVLLIWPITVITKRLKVKIFSKLLFSSDFAMIYLSFICGLLYHQISKYKIQKHLNKFNYFLSSIFHLYDSIVIHDSFWGSILQIKTTIFIEFISQIRNSNVRTSTVIPCLLISKWNFSRIVF